MKNFGYLFLFSFIYIFLSVFLFVKVPNMATRMEIDSPAYTNYTECFEKNCSFVQPGQTECKTWFSIGYPLFMVGVRNLFGKSYLPVILIQILLGLLSILLIFKIAAYFFSSNVSLLATFFASISLAFLIYPQFILTESLLCFLLIFAFERFSAFLHCRHWNQIIISGFLFGISIIVKSAAIYFIVFLTFFLLICGSKNKIKKVESAFVFLLFFFIPVFGYVFYNKQTYGYWYLKSVDKVNLYDFLLPQILQEQEGLSDEEAKDRAKNLRNVKEFASGTGWEKAQDLLIEKIKEDPVLVIRIWLKNVMKTFLGLYTNHLKVLLYPQIKGGDCSYFYFSGSWHQKAWKYFTFGTNSKSVVVLGIVEAFWNLVRYLFVFLGFIYLLIKRKYLWFILFGGYIFYFSFITGHAGCGRFRSMIEAPLLIMTALGVCVLYDLFVKKKISILKNENSCVE